MEDMKVDENYYLQPIGELKGHNGWVTSLATTFEAPDMLLSASRDKTIIKWKLLRTQEEYGVPERRMKGHGHYVEDIAISSDGQFALSGSWDGTLRLWDLQTGVTTCRFVGHSKDVLSVAFSPGNRQIVSGSRDHGVELWNTLGVNKVHLSDKNNGGHTDWVSCVRFSPNTKRPMIVSASWDKTVKVWDLEKYELKSTLRGHTGYVNAVTVSPDGSLCASGGKDGFAKLWDVNEGKCLHNLEAKDIIHELVFSPSRYWLCAATASAIKVFNLETKNCIETVTLDEDPESKKLPTQCISLAWSADGNTLFAGYTDGVIRVYAVSK